VEASLNLVVVLDYFDSAAAGLDVSFFDYLFHLRNARPRGNLVYVFVTRRPLGRLGELQELLDEGCVIGPLGYRDALDSIRRDEARLGCVFDAAQRDKLIACTGGHPGFLKNAGELLASGALEASLPEREMACQMLQAGRVRALCEELWHDLKPVEQAVLAGAAKDLLLPRSADVVCLERNGLLVGRDGRLAIFGPLFEAFVREQAFVSGAVRIEAVFPNLARVKTVAGEESVTLSPKLFALLATLGEGRGRVLSADVLITGIYGSEAAGVTNAALSQLVKRLRTALDPRVRRMIGDRAYTCVETVRDVGYRFNG
jgi:DNA-binding response OmpR family regulator